MVIVPEKRYQVRLDVYGALAAVDRPVRDGADKRIWYYFDYNLYDVQGRRTIFFWTFKYFKLVGFTFNFGLQITHQKILMLLNFGVAIYIVGKLISR